MLKLLRWLVFVGVSFGGCLLFGEADVRRALGNADIGKVDHVFAAARERALREQTCVTVKVSGDRLRTTTHRCGSAEPSTEEKTSLLYLRLCGDASSTTFLANGTVATANPGSLRFVRPGGHCDIRGWDRIIDVKRGLVRE
jgi:hypothetical protein